jgi:bifunctional DNase/RNase
MKKIQLQILGISSGQTSTSYTLILEEENGDRKLPIIIGAFEAQAIAIEIEKISPVRPMTHDLFRDMANLFDITISEVLIHKLQDGVFYANIICTNGITTEEIDARTSDAIALALRFKCPIYTYEDIMLEAGILLGEPETEGKTHEIKAEVPAPPAKTRKTQEKLSSLSNEELDKMLEVAIEDENYILAAKIRDELKKREDK